jgi:hypothetical protein
MAKGGLRLIDNGGARPRAGYSTGALRACRMVSTYFFLGGLCASCAVPRYDVPYVAGAPSAHSIVARLECELLDLVRDGAVGRDWLLTGDYQVAVALSLEVNDTGGLAPSVSYINPLSAVTSFTFGGSANLSESRDHNFTENLQFSLRAIHQDWKRIPTAYQCPTAPDTNLAGTLGISDFVAMAAVSPGLDEDRKSPNSVFGGSVQFIVTKSVSALGPTWSLVHFKGPGGVNFSQINTDKMTLAFAKGPNQGKPLVIANAPNTNAYLFLQQLLTSSINSQLIYLQSNLTGLPVQQNILPSP